MTEIEFADFLYDLYDKCVNFPDTIRIDNTSFLFKFVHQWYSCTWREEIPEGTTTQKRYMYLEELRHVTSEDELNELIEKHGK